jgi:hypothetical protein
MSGEVTSAAAAIMGAFVGGLASLMSTWVGERSRHRRDMVQHEITKRETAYADFIDKASTVFVASATHNFNDDEVELEGTVSLYAVASRIRLFASDPVMQEAEQVLDLVFAQYGAENLSIEQLRETAMEKKDPLKAFSAICRHELNEVQRRMPFRF